MQIPLKHYKAYCADPSNSSVYGVQTLLLQLDVYKVHIAADFLKALRKKYKFVEICYVPGEVCPVNQACVCSSCTADV